MASTACEVDQKTRNPHFKVTQEGSKRCYMHLSSVQDEDVQEFSHKRWETYRACLRQWLSLQGPSKDVAEKHKHCVDVDFDNAPKDAGFHKTCYIRFICKRRLSLAEKKRETAASDQSAPSDSMADAKASTSISTEPPRKKFRSRTGLPMPSAGYVLPPLCIICKKVEKLITMKGKRQRDKLSQAKTLTAGLLQKAAELKEDTSVLLHIKEKDCVALGVRYHRTCYAQYTKFLSRPTETSTTPRDKATKTPFTDSYNLFCETVIRQKIIVDQEVLRMDKLQKTFVDIVKNQEGLDASEYRRDLLKRRLTRDFPQLTFHRPAKRNICELVFVETLSADRLLQKIPMQSSTFTEATEVTEAESETDSDSEQMASITFGQNTSEIQDRYRLLIVRGADNQILEPRFICRKSVKIVVKK
ncbi:uncharacterized protein LOC130921360 [Corythoichthys intestinalis]|uniref:uncharacterized protein LOC130921360 n=1 Tax=Corythoichthys intestinalis TaxID=161448 RepID=UPI0025A54791|nr:uncharacterized protein LOC130921360 [Corythoichthys intestinalis]